MRVWIGTSGYSYPDWIGDFYPAGTRPAGLLHFYSRYFPLVELNFTFYRPPTASMLAALAEKSPPGFQFLVKVPQTISHEHRFEDLAGFCLAAGELERRGRLLGVLLQLPQSCHHGKRQLDWLASLGERMHELRPAVEFRHRSWDRPDLAEWLTAKEIDLVAVDVPDLPGLFPGGWARSGRRAYVRLHSRDAANWYTGDKARYDYNFSDAELAEWIDAAVTAAPTTDDAMFLFNNCYRGQAVVNARRMFELCALRTPQLDPVKPLAEHVPVQKSLFE